MWQPVEHSSEMFRHTDMACWLSEKLNEMGATQMYILQFDLKSDIFRAVAFVPDDNHTVVASTAEVPLTSTYGHIPREL